MTLNTNILNIVLPVLILVYIFHIESEKCKCVMDWRHNYIKYYLLSFIVLIILAITINLDKIIKPLFTNETATGLLLLLILLITNIIYLYSVYVYVGELDKTRCECAMHDMKYLHNTLYYFRYIMIVIAIIAVLPVFDIISKLVKKIM
jgi:hypothetical protein